MTLATYKNIIGVTAVLLVFIGYIPYFRDILKGKTIPHVYSYFLWGFVTTIAFALQISGGGGVGSFVTLAAALMCGIVIILSFLRQKSQWDITFADTLFLILAFISLGIWLIAKQPVLSAILATTTDLLGFVPTIRKSWNRPHTETLSLYLLNTVRFAMAAFSLQVYSVVTLLYPLTWCLANGLFALMLLTRRRAQRK